MRTWAPRAAVKALINADVDSMFTRRMGRVLISDSPALAVMLIIDGGRHKKVDGWAQEGVYCFLAPPLCTLTLTFVALSHLWKANPTFDELIPTKANFSGKHKRRRQSAPIGEKWHLMSLIAALKAAGLFPDDCLERCMQMRRILDVSCECHCSQ